jgi:hypothetical protein
MIAIRNFRMWGMSTAIAAVTILSACGNNVEPSGSQPPPVAESPSTSVLPASESPAEQDKIVEAFVLLASSDVSADQLLKQLVESLGKVDPEQADDMLRAMDDYYSRNLPKIEEEFYPDDVQKELSVLKFPITEDQFANIQDPEVRSLVQQTLAGGYKLDMAEGVVFPVIGYAELNALADGASDAMQDYLDLMAVESEARIARDAALVISRDELARRALAAEAFIREHADAPELHKVKNQYMIYIRSYLFGLDNTPNTEDDFKFKPQFRSEMEKLIAENTGTVTADLAGQLLEILDSTGGYLFQKDPEVYQKDIPEVRAFMDSLEERARKALEAQ